MMTDATVCMPWRATPDRIPAHDRCVKFWTDNGFPVIEADSNPSRGFHLNQARNNGVRQATTEIVIIADADGLPDTIEQIHSAVAEAADGTGKVVWPFTICRRIPAEWATRPEDLSEAPILGEFHRTVGGLHVIARRTLWNLGGFDENFIPGAWGWDDAAFYYCAMTLATTVRIIGVLWSIDHDAGPSMHWSGRDLSEDNPNKTRFLLYESANGNPKIMRELIKARPPEA